MDFLKKWVAKKYYEKERAELISQFARMNVQTIARGMVTVITLPDASAQTLSLYRVDLVRFLKEYHIKDSGILLTNNVATITVVEGEKND